MKKTFPYRYRVLLFLGALSAITYLDRICVSIVGVRIKSDLRLNNEQFGWVLGAFALAYALFELPSGILGDRIGPRKVLIRIVLIWSFFTALTGLANGLLFLIAVRFFFGAGESGAYPNSLIVISRWLPVFETARSCSVLSIGMSIGSAFAPLLIIPIASSFGWRVPFFVNAVIGTAWVCVCIRWFRDFPSGMKQIPENEKNYIELNRRFQKDEHLLSWKLIFRNSNLRALMAMYFFNQMGLYFFVAWMPVFLQEGRHFTENQSKSIIFSVFIVGALGYLSGGAISDWLARKYTLRFGRRFVAMLGLGFSSIFIFISGLPIPNRMAAISMIAGSLFYSSGNIMTLAVSTDICRNNAGTVFGAVNFSGQLGAFCLAILFGKIADATHSFRDPIFLLSFGLLGACLLWLRIDPAKQITGAKPVLAGHQLREANLNGITTT